MDKLRLRISKKGVGFQICSVSMRKLRLLVDGEHKFWKLESGSEGDFLVLYSY